MRILKRSALALGLFTAALGSGCATTYGSGTITTEDRAIHGVSSVSVAGNAEIEIEQDGTESLSITADDNLLPLLQSEVHGGELVLDVKDHARIQPTRKIHYKLTVLGLTGLSLAGDADAELRKIATDRLRVTLAGDGRIHADGMTDHQEIAIIGNGNYDGTGFASKTASVTITGDGKLDLDVSEKLDIKIIGDGSITYTGDPVITRSVIGGGSINRK